MKKNSFNAGNSDSDFLGSLDFGTGEGSMDLFPGMYVKSKRKTSRFNTQPNSSHSSPTVTRRPVQGQRVAHPTSQHTHSVNSPSRGHVMNENTSRQQHPVSNSNLSGNYHNVNPPAPVDYRNRYFDSENARKVYITYLERDYGVCEKENRKVLEKWMEEAQRLDKEEFLKAYRDSLQVPPMYYQKYYSYYQRKERTTREQYQSKVAEYDYHFQILTGRVEEYKTANQRLNAENQRLEREVNILRTESQALRKDQTRIQREWDEEKKKVLKDMNSMSASKRKMISTFRTIINDIQESHLNGLRKKNEESTNSIKTWAKEVKDGRAGVPKILKSFKEEIEKVVEKEKRSLTTFSSKITNILDQQDQKILNSIKDKVFEKLASSMDIGQADDAKKE